MDKVTLFKKKKKDVFCTNSQRQRELKGGRREKETSLVCKWL